MSESDTPGFAASMLPRSAFPITMEAHNADGELVWSETVTEEMAENLVSVRVPALAKDHGPVSITTTYGNGKAVTVHPEELDG